jgi:ABC-2 type transport system permease protein
VSVFLALAELRLRLTVRRLLGRGGVQDLVARSVMIALAVPTGLVFAALAGRGVFFALRMSSPRAIALATALFFFGVWTSWTSLSLTMSDRESFDLRRVLVYPVPPWQAYLYELGAGLLADPFAIFWLLLQAGAFVGAAAARPGGWVLLLALAHALFAAGTVCLVALLQEILARALSRRRVRELGVAAVYIGVIVLVVYVAADGGRAVWNGLRALAALRWLAAPAALAVEATQALYVGDVAGALPWLGALAAAVPAIAWAAYRLALADALGGVEGARARGGAGGGWRIPGRLGPLLEKELKYLLRHPLTAVLALVLPALAAAVGWKALPLLPPDAIYRSLPLFGFALYTLLVTQAVWLNAFGWDRGGVRLWFLAPVAPADVLRAKNAASSFLAFALFALTAAALSATGGLPQPWAICAALALHLGAGAWWTAAGNLVSILNPRPAAHSLQRGASLAPMTALAGMAIVSGGVTLFGLPVLLARSFDDPWLLVAIWTALAVAGAGVRRAVRPLTARLLERRREQVLAAVAGDDA